MVAAWPDPPLSVKGVACETNKSCGGGKVKFVFTSTVKVFFFTGSLSDSWSEKQYNCLQPAANEHPDWASCHFITFVLPLNIISSQCFHTLCNHVTILTNSDNQCRCMLASFPGLPWLQFLIAWSWERPGNEASACKDLTYWDVHA